jgi:DNA-binding MarR family transcriptional regulator
MQSLSKQENLGILIGAARRRLKQVTGNRVRGHGLSAPQFWVFVTIAENRGVGLCDLTDGLGTDAPTASRIVSALRLRRLVTIGGSAADRRRHRLDVTDKGSVLYQKLKPLAVELRGAVVRGFSAREQETLRRLLGRVIENLDALDRTFKEGAA